VARRKRDSRLLVPEAGKHMGAFKAEVMAKKGYRTDPLHPDAVKYEVAQTLGVPLKPGYNGRLEAQDAGKVGGPIGGAMVREMIRIAQEKLSEQ
jgi:small acid-soluble spore protein D (minor alpha/beta-type SASP)